MQQHIEAVSFVSKPPAELRGVRYRTTSTTHARFEDAPWLAISKRDALKDNIYYTAVDSAGDAEQDHGRMST